ncbi:hypothetical protein [Bradyrhizobium sp. 5.13L]
MLTASTKTVNAALIGMAIKDGKLSLDQKGLFPQWARECASENLGSGLDGHAKRFGIQRGRGPPPRRRAFGILGERCGGSCEGQSARRRARDDISLWVRIIRLLARIRADAKFTAALTRAAASIEPIYPPPNTSSNRSMAAISSRMPIPRCPGSFTPCRGKQEWTLTSDSRTAD